MSFIYIKVSFLRPVIFGSEHTVVLRLFQMPRERCVVVCTVKKTNLDNERTNDEREIENVYSSRQRKAPRVSDCLKKQC